FLHRGDEKIAENMQYNQFVPYTDRLDYLAPLANNVAYALAVEKLMGWEIPPRGKTIRVICCELSRISSHLMGLGALALDLGRMTAIAYALSGPNLRGSGVEHDLRRKHPYLDYEQYDFEVVIGSAGDCYDRYLVRVEEMRQSAKILRQVIDRLPSGPINVADWKNMTPPKSHVMTKMEELIHHF